MNQLNETIHNLTSTKQKDSNSSSDEVVQADSLLQRAREEQAELAGLLNANSVEAQYGMTLAAQVEFKHDQAERIEDKLENLIEQQSSRLQQTRSRQPGIMSLPASHANWQQQIQQQQSTMQRLQGRLELVREIKDGMGLHGHRIEELAARKLRVIEPALVSEWDALQKEQRRRVALQRNQEPDVRQARNMLSGKGRGLSNTFTHSDRS